jgi:hypothetical protein
VLDLAVGAMASFVLLALGPLVVLRQRLQPQFFGIGRFRSGQRARRRSVSTGEAVEKAAQTLHSDRVARRPVRKLCPARFVSLKERVDVVFSKATSIIREGRSQPSTARVNRTSSTLRAKRA